MRALWLLLAVGCVDQAELLEELQLPKPPAEDPNAEVTIFDPKAKAIVPDRTVVFEPAMAGEVMQGGDIAMAWTGSRYVIAWEQNRRGRIFVLVRAIDPANPQQPEPIQTMSGDYEELEQSPRASSLLWHDGRLLLAWTTDGGAVMMRWLDERARPIEGPIEAIRFSEGHQIAILPRRDGYLMLAASNRWREVRPIRALLLDRGGGPISEATILEEPYASWSTAVVDDLQTLHLLWGTRLADGMDRVFLSRFLEGGPLGATLEVYQADSAIPLWLGPARSPRRFAVWDLDAGTRLVDPLGAPPLLLNEPGYNASLIVHEEERPRIAVIHEAGTYQPTNPLPTRVEFQAVDYASREVGERVVIDDGSSACLEDLAAASAGERVGVAWTFGCSERRLFFAELRARVREM